MSVQLFLIDKYWRYLTSLHLFFIYSLFPNVNTVNHQFDSTIKRQSIINRQNNFP